MADGELDEAEETELSIVPYGGRALNILDRLAISDMPEAELETVMTDFTRGKSDVLVCTTIIESGLDMPNVNTLIVNRADRFGLTQLYQLRGRIGRGAELAHAYFLYEREKRLTPTAEKRLRTIFEATELGADAFTPFTCERSLHFEVTDTKLSRWRKIVIEAARQSQRLWLPEIERLISFTSLAESAYPVKIALRVKAKKLRTILPRTTGEVFLAVGPEGDFSDREIKTLSGNSFYFVSLSPHILRLETAAIFATGLIKSYLDES
jgi:hypothetical protein